MKSKIKIKARSLRSKGDSFSMIAHKLNISKSTASLWTRDIQISESGLLRLHKISERARKISGLISHRKKVKRLYKVKLESRKLLSELNYNNNLAILVSLYLCEGSKDETSLRFTNSDPGVIALYLQMLRNSFDIEEDKLRARVHVHDNQNNTELVTFWSHITKIPVSRFYKSYIKPSKHTYIKVGYKGCLHLIYKDSHISRVIQYVAKSLTKLYI